MKRLFKAVAATTDTHRFELPENCAGIYVNICEIGGVEMTLENGGTNKRQDLIVTDLAAGYGYNFTSPLESAALVLTFPALNLGEAVEFTMTRDIEIIAIHEGETYTPPRAPMGGRIYPIMYATEIAASTAANKTFAALRTPIPLQNGPAIIAAAVCTDKRVDFELHYLTGGCVIPYTKLVDIGNNTQNLSMWTPGASGFTVTNNFGVAQTVAIIAVVY